MALLVVIFYRVCRNHREHLSELIQIKGDMTGESDRTREVEGIIDPEGTEWIEPFNFRRRTDTVRFIVGHDVHVGDECLVFGLVAEITVYLPA